MNLSNTRKKFLANLRGWLYNKKTILSYLRPYKLPVAAAYSLMFIELVVELLLPFFLGKMINQGVLNKDLDNIIMWGSIMIAMALTAFIAGIFNSFFAAHTTFAFSYDLREKLFEKIQGFSFADLNLYPASGLVTRFSNDIRQLQNLIFMGLRIMMKAPLLIIGGVMMAFIVDYQLALIFLVTVPLLVGFLLWVLKMASRMFNNVQQNVDNVNQVMQENLAGMRLIKAFVRRNHESARFSDANEQLADVTRKTFRFIETSMPILLFVMNLSLIFILWFGNNLAIAGETSVGNVVAIVNYALRVSMAISMLTFIILAFSRARASAERINEVLQVKSDLVDFSESKSGDAPIKGKVSFSDVGFSYPKSNRKTLQNIDFTINTGEKLAIIGSTGSGKTSLFQLIPRLYEPQHGKIFLDDKPITSFTLNEVRQSIGYVPQTPILFGGSVHDNIAWGKNNATQKDVIQAAKDAQIHETVLELDDGYNTRIGQKGVNLSGGQKQRLSIARALIRHPKLLMLDDSTSALDLTTEGELLEAIQKYGCTTLIITQKISTAINADRILLLNDGKMLAIGSHEELLNSSALYTRIVASQFGKEYANAYS